MFLGTRFPRLQGLDLAPATLAAPPRPPGPAQLLHLASNCGGIPELCPLTHSLPWPTLGDVIWSCGFEANLAALELQMDISALSSFHSYLPPDGFHNSQTHLFKDESDCVTLLFKSLQ